MKGFSKIAVIIYGPPGSGKGTQAELLAKKLELIHFDTGRYLEKLVHDPQKRNNPIIRRERKNFDTGILMTPSWVLKIAAEKTKKIAQTGWGIIFSGSPRTVYEAFGQNQKSGLLKILEKLYGRSHIFIFKLNVRPATSIRRNSQRLLCSNCGQALLGFYSKIKKNLCPFCGAALRKRTLDNPETIKIRLKQYKDRTDPIFAGLKKRDYQINQINGEVVPYKVFNQIIKKIK